MGYQTITRQVQLESGSGRAHARVSPGDAGKRGDRLLSVGVCSAARWPIDHPGLFRRPAMPSHDAAPVEDQPDAPFVLCFDGSDSAADAMRQAAAITGGGAALVVHVWLPPSGVMLPGRTIESSHPLAPAAEEFDASAREAAERVAADGAGIAAEAGFDAEPLAVESRRGVWQPIVELAEERGARAVIVGSQGLSRVKSALLGSVSNGLVNHCRRPVIVVPS
jgi:nucleotide-binding universal stress UspA family protein